MQFDADRLSFHTRHHRNYSTVLSTQSRIFWFTVLESVIVIGMSLYVFSLSCNSYPQVES